MLAASLVLVNYRSADLVVETLAHLDALGEERPQQVLVVDNSPDEVLGERVAPGVTYVPAGGNRGFAGGVNLGLEHAAHDVVILLNPDARPEPGCLAGLVEHFRTTPDAGIVAPALLSPGGSPAALASATRVDPGWLSTLAEHTIVHRLLPSDWLDEHYFLRSDQADGPVTAAAVQGSCFAFRREIVERIGLFDEERFLLYWEETDFCRRARRAEWQVVFDPTLACVHSGGGSTPDLDAARDHFWHGLFAYHRKHGGLALASLLRVSLALGIAAEVALLGALRLVRPADEKLRADLEENRKRLVQVVRIRGPARLP